MSGVNRRTFHGWAASAAVAALPAARVAARTSETTANAPPLPDAINQIRDPLVQQGVRMALERTLLPAAKELAYPGHSTVTADGKGFGAETTWPGLDSWQMAGAYILLGRQRMAQDYFDFVEASQREDGNIPFAIYPAESPPPGIDTYGWRLRWPEDVYSYTPRRREGQPAHSHMGTRKWIGLFHHWQKKVNPLSVLGPISYILTAAEIHAAEHSPEWLQEKLESLLRAGAHVVSRLSDNGLLGGAGFYTEAPPRNQWDGVTQCYGVHVFRTLARLLRDAGRPEDAGVWEGRGDALAAAFRREFWQNDHFAEYVHPEHGVVDLHGLSDVNWAAIAFDVALPEQSQAVWPLLTAAKELWHGDMPTQPVAKPYGYRDWELSEPLPFHNRAGVVKDVSAMGRVWYLETLACQKMGDVDRLKRSVQLVCKIGEKYDWLWYERYCPIPREQVAPLEPAGYCEYPSILVRAVLGNLDLFTSA